MSYFDSNSSLENLSTAVIWTNSMKKAFNIKPVPKSVDKNRCATDKYWIGFFVIIFMAWIVAWQYAIIHHETNYKVHSDNNIQANNNTNQFIHRELANTSEIAPQLSTDIRTNPCIDSILDRRQRANEIDGSELLTEFFLIIFDIYTCNPSRLHRRMGTHKILVLIVTFQTLATGLFLITAFIDISNNRVFCKQTSIVGATLLFIALIEHLSIVYHSRSNAIVSPLLPFHEKLAGWMIPEILFIILWFSQMISVVSCAKSEDSHEKISQNSSHNDSENKNADNDFHKGIIREKINIGANNIFSLDIASDDCSDEDEDDSDDDTDVGIIPFHNYVYAIIFGFPIVVLLKLVFMSTISMLYKMSWNNPYPYILAGSSFYLCLTTYYFGLMLTAYATNILIDTDNLSLKDLLRTFSIVSRYHFGTACYHGTLIFPRLYVTFIMNESEFKEIPESLTSHNKSDDESDNESDDKSDNKSDDNSDDKSDKESNTHSKYYVAHCMVYRFSPTLTATRGCGFSNSIKESFRLCKSIYSKKEYFYCYGWLSMSLLMFLLATNNIMNLILLCLGISDSTFANATWTMYVKIMFTFVVAMSFFKTVADTIGLRLFGIQAKTIKSAEEK